MADLCRRADAARGAPSKIAWGTTQKELYVITNLYFKTATLQELERVAITFSRHCEKFLA
jgi:hypothetical protein